MEDDPKPISPETSGLSTFWRELRRRKVVRVAVVYAVVAWLLIQVSATVFPQFGIPPWGTTFVTLLLAIGFPITLIMAWAFEITPEGIKSASDVQPGEGVAPVKGNRLNLFMFGFISLALLFLIIDRYLFDGNSGGAKTINRTLPASEETVRFTITLPDSLSLPSSLGNTVAVSPDGRTIVYRAQGMNSVQLYKQQIDQFNAVPIIGTENGQDPFFSPDGQWLGFAVRYEMLKVNLEDGRVQEITDSIENGYFRGGTWGSNSTIVLVQGPGLKKFSASGGEPSVILDKYGSHKLWYPHIVPGTDAILYTVGDLDTASEYKDIHVLFPRTGESRLVLSGASAGRVTKTGHLMFMRSGGLWAAPFDLEHFEVLGTPQQVVGQVHEFRGGAVQFSVADNGTLVYVPRSVRATVEGTLVLVDREGNRENLPLSSNFYVHPRFSPDGSQIAIEIHATDGSNIFIYEPSNNRLRQLTFNGGEVPIWTPDGSQITFFANDALWNIASDFSEEPQLLSTASEEFGIAGPYSWSPDGRVLVWDGLGGAAQLTRIEEGKVEHGPLLNEAYNEGNPNFSADGNWFSYYTDETDSWEVYVQPYPLGTGRKRRITQTGGNSVVWARGGREIFYSNEEQLWVVKIQTEPTLKWQDPVALFDSPWLLQFDSFVNYDVTPDGQQFVFVQPEEDQSNQSRQIRVVVNWFEELNRLVPIPE